MNISISRLFNQTHLYYSNTYSWYSWAKVNICGCSQAYISPCSCINVVPMCLSPVGIWYEGNQLMFYQLMCFWRLHKFVMWMNIVKLTSVLKEGGWEEHQHAS